MKNFAVIQFVKGNAIDFVPSSWINESQLKCRYPKTSFPGFEELRRTPGSDPPRSWPKYSVVIVKYYDDVSKAERKAINYLETSDIDSSEAEGRAEARISTIQTLTSEIVEQPLQISTASINSSPSSSFIPAGSSQAPSHIFGLVGPSGRHDTTVNVSQFVPPEDSLLGFPLNVVNTLVPPPVQVEQGDNNTNALLNKILEKQNVLEQQIKDIKKLLLPAVTNSSATSSQVPSIPFIPIANPSELESFESWIQSQANFSLLVSSLSKIGGHEVSLTTYAILNYLFLHEFALTVRLTEKSGKLGIGSKKVVQAVRESVRVSYPHATDKDLNQYIGCWFRTSSDRKGGRKRRCQNGNPSENCKAARQEGTRDHSEANQAGDNQHSN